MAVCALLLLPAFPGSGVRCGRVCWGPDFGCAPPLLEEVLLGCACGRPCAPLAPVLPGGPPMARGCAGVAVGSVCPPPPLWCSLGGGLCGVGPWLSRPWVSWSLSPHPFSSGPRCLLFVFFFVPAWCVSACFGCPLSRWAAALGLLLPVLAEWSPGAPLVGPVFGAVLVGGLAATCGVGGRRGGCGPFSRPPRPPPCCVFLGGGSACSYLCLPWAGARTGGHSLWLSGLLLVVALCQAVPQPRSVGLVMYTLGSAPLPAGLGSGSAGRAVAPGGFVWPWVSRVLSSPRCRF